MRYTAVVTAVALAGVRTVAGMMINTPMNTVVCQPVMLSWSSNPGVPPYYLSVIPGGQPSAPAIKTFPTTEATSITWKVDIQAGTDVTISLKDSTGAQAYTDHFMIQNGPDSSCVNTNATPATVSGASGSPPASAPAGGATPAASQAASAPASAPASSGSAPAASASSTGRPTGSQAAAASAKPSNGAVSLAQSVTGGLAGVLAIAGALVF